VKDVKRMTIEILKSYEFGDPRSFVPVNYENLKSWRRLETEIAEIHAKGGVVDIPGYDCPYTEYDTKTRTYTRTPPPDSPAAIDAEQARHHQPTKSNPKATLATTRHFPTASNYPATSEPVGNRSTSDGTGFQ